MTIQVSADPDTRIISFIVAPVSSRVTVDVAKEIYSQLKIDWLSTASLQKLKFPLRPVGGDAISVTETVGKYVFLANDDGWRLEPYDADHELRLTGNIFPEDSDTVMWLSRAGRTITIQVERSAQALGINSTSASSNRIWSIPI